MLAFKDVLNRSNMFAHHHVQREPLSVREPKSAVLMAVQGGESVEFVKLFDPQEGRMGVTVTFLAILELVKESLLDIVQPEPFAPIVVRGARSIESGEPTSEQA